MPYVSKRIPAIAARAYVMRVEGCDSVAATRQIEAAALDGALRWVRRGNSRWDWDAEVFRTDLLKLWPMPPAEQDLPVLLGDAAAPAAAGRTSDVRNDVEAAAAWLEKPVPDRAELQPLRVMRARLRNTVQAAIQAREPADIAEDKCQEAAKDVDGEILTWLADSQLAAFLETQCGLEPLPNGPFWTTTDGRATEHAKRAFSEGTAASNHHPRRVAGTVMVHVGDFEAIAEQYLAAQGLGKYQISRATPHRFEDPVWDQRDVFGWVLDRDPSKFGRIHSESDWRSAEWIIKFQPTMPRPEHDPQAGQTLLHALQKGDLVAYRETTQVSPDFWIDKTPQYIRDSSDFLFRREHVLALWSDQREQKSRLPPPITPLRGGRATAVADSVRNESRAPNWQKWKHVPEVKLYVAVALSLNIAPEKVQRKYSSWTGAVRFNESQEFVDRLFVATANLKTLLPVNSRAMRYYDEDPVVSVQQFVAWAVSIGWSLPSELTGLATDATGSRSSPTASEAATARQAGARCPESMAEAGGAPSTLPSEQTKAEPLLVVLADAHLRDGLQQLCRAGRVRAEGRRITYQGHEAEPGKWTISEEISKRYELIPPEDWVELLLMNYPGELRLEGSREWFAPERAFELKGWAYVRVNARDLSDLIEDTRRRREASENAAPNATIPVPETSPAAKLSAARKPSSRLKPFWPAAGHVARQWLEDNGCPVAGDGEQGKLEAYVSDWLASRGHHPVPSTIRIHVRTWIGEYRNALSS